MTAHVPGEAIRRCVRAVLRYAHKFPHLLLIHALLRDRYVEDDDVASIELGLDGTLRVSPSFVARTPPGMLAGCLFHVMLHVVLSHAARRRHRDEGPWWFAADAVINAALEADGLELPDRAVKPPTAYQGPLQVEPLADFLACKMSRTGANGIKQGQVTSGCSVPEDWADAGLEEGPRRALAEAMAEAFTLARASGAGTGTSAVLDLLAPVPPRLDWRNILRHGVHLARATLRRDRQSYTRVDRRREPQDGILLPGWRSDEVRIAVLVDVSGSMERAWVARIASEIRALSRQFPEARIWLGTHTDRLCWSGWVQEGTLSEEMATRALGWSGGTNPEPAYQAAREAGKFEAVIHFTDGIFPVDRWPALPPGARLVVGVFGDGDAGALRTVPAGTTLVACTHPRDDADSLHDGHAPSA